MAQRVVIPGFRKIESGGSGEGGTNNYNDLTNKPSINNVPLVGNLNTSSLKLTDATLTEEGVPAEAKKVGDKLEEHSTSLTALSEQLGSHTVKSDVPENAVFTDTVYDDTEVQKRISDNGYGEIAGGKNLVKSYSSSETADAYYIALQADVKLKQSTTYTISFIGTKNNLIYGNEDIFNNPVLNISCTGERQSITMTTLSTPSELDSQFKIIFKNSQGNTVIPNFIDVQIEEGSVATEYEPYFPSNKMLAEEVSAQNESLEDYGLNNKFDGQWKVGYYTSTGEYMTDGNITTSNPISVIGGANISVKYPDADNMTIAYFNGSTFISRSLNKYDDVAPTNSTLCYVTIQKQVNNIFISPSTADKLSVYVDNAIDKLKNDLAPKKIELQNVDERVTIQDNGSFIINGFAFVNLLVTFNETIEQWTNFVRLPRPKVDRISVHCENSVKLTIYNQYNLPGDCGTNENVASGTKIRLLANYEVLN